MGAGLARDVAGGAREAGDWLRGRVREHGYCRVSEADRAARRVADETSALTTEGDGAMIEAPRRHGPFDPRFRGPGAHTNGHRRSIVKAKQLEAKRLEQLEAKRLGKARRDAAGWAALQAWEDEGGATRATQ
jgi:hypothetical protein